MNRQILPLAVLLALSSLAQAQQAVQWRVEDGGNGHWYELTQQADFWPALKSFAQSRGGNLVSIHSAAENSFVYSLLPSTAPSAFYIGGFKCPSEWTWADGTPWSYTNWDVGEPNGGGCQITWIHGPLAPRPATWNDHPASDYQFRGVIEYQSDCDGDGIVDKGQIVSGQLADVNQNGVPDCCDLGVSCFPCPGDVSGNRTVDAVDLAALLAAWGTSGQGEFDTDVDNSGVVDGGDLALLLSAWGPCPQ
jgi:hypothetical protein